MQFAPLFRAVAALSTAATLAASPAGAQTLYSQANLVTNPGAGFNGANTSAVQTSLGNGTIGYTANAAGGFRIADNFSITGNPWTISGFRFFGYQTTSGTNLVSPFTSVGWQIWSGRPGDAGAAVIAGSISSNTLTYTGFSGIYRTLEGDLESRLRPVMVVDANASGVTLGAGSYWLEWVMGTASGNSFVPPVTFNGILSSGDARQYNANSGNWGALAGTNTAELPFEVFGTVNHNVVPEPSTYALMATGLVGIIGMARRRTRTA